jgi:hypothetical protein
MLATALPSRCWLWRDVTTEMQVTTLSNRAGDGATESVLAVVHPGATVDLLGATNCHGL